MLEKFFMHLNQNQIDAVKATEGKVRVVAGAGSGKTRVLAYRYAYLVEYVGIDPANILCMTFTNKAAQEMRTRIRKMVNIGNVNDYICTIHGLCVKILRKEIYRLGYPGNFTIIDKEDSKSLMKQVMDEQNITKQGITVNQLLDNVGVTKGNSDYVSFILPNVPFPPETDTSAFLRFLQLQRQYYALDFNDLIFFTLYIFKHFPDALQYWQNEFDYIQVDEVQDCSNSDWEIIDYLTEKCENLFIVGDPDQAIYEWRGAKPYRFVEFKADTDIILDENYRSTPNILNVANSIIQYNRNRVEKNLRTSIPSDAIVIHKHAKDEVEEGEWISSLISEMTKKGKKPSEFAILFRASSLSRFIEQALMSKQLPYTIWGGIRFFERKEIKDCIAYLRLINNMDDISFKRVVNVPSRKFGKVKLETLERIAKNDNSTLFETLRNHIDEKPFNSIDIKDFVYLIEQIKEKKDKESIPDLLEEVLDLSGLKDIYRNDGDEERIENIKELINSIRYYEQTNVNEEVSLDRYLQDIALFTNSDYKKDQETIKLMTIHQSKGLEFPYVFVIGLTEGIFPNYRTIRERRRDGLEEERRLMYVAITRAKKALFLTESEGYNYMTKSDKFPSRFIAEISKDLIKVEGYIDPSLVQGCKDLISRFETEESKGNDRSFQTGQEVKHELFGEGCVLSVNEERKSCEVKFSNKIRNILFKFLTFKE
ncbi:MAG: UvrD-helicase domain-containing protein [Bacteroidaceae bacterium]|nr:UvrD-helicase domain-containing protein [Bacteroidaceae bacterium]